VCLKGIGGLSCRGVFVVFELLLLSCVRVSVEIVIVLIEKSSTKKRKEIEY
jgi:hypothetical protein